MHHPVAIANEFIELNKSHPMSLMQILKLSYIAHGFSLGLDEGVLSNEFAQAWKFGPVFPSIYNAFKHTGGKNISEKEKFFPEYDSYNLTDTSNFNEIDRGIMSVVHRIYSHLDGWGLSDLTHKKGTPWDKSWNGEHGGAKGFRGVTIPNEEIREHFKNDVIPKVYEKIGKQ